MPGTRYSSFSASICGVRHFPGKGPVGNRCGNVNRQVTALQSSEPFVVMAKPVGPVCNLECSYCYYLPTGSFYQSPHQFKMPDALLETYVRQYIEASPGPTVPFVWHGGEPTLAGLDFYRRAVELQKRYLPPGWTCWNNLQTNGTLLDDEWCSFLADAHFDVGLSIDGTQWVHDGTAKTSSGAGPMSAALAAVRRLQAHGIQPDLLCTVTFGHRPGRQVAVYRALRDLNTGWIQFIPIVRRAPDGTITPDSVPGEAYGRFLSVVFDEWVHHDLGKLNVQQFAEMSLVWSGGNASACWMAPTCGRVLILEHDGAVYSCDHFVTPEHRIGDLGELAIWANWWTQRRSAASVRISAKRCRPSAALVGGWRCATATVPRTGSPGRRWRARTQLPV